MNPTTDERFYELAMKSIVGQSTAEEKVELEAALAENADRATELAQLRAQAEVAKDLLALVEATAATGPSLPVAVRDRLRKRVDETHGRPKEGWKESDPAGAEDEPIDVDIIPPKLPPSTGSNKNGSHLPTVNPPPPGGPGSWKIFLWILFGAALMWVAYNFVVRPQGSAGGTIDPGRGTINIQVIVIQPMISRSEQDYGPVVVKLKETFPGCRIEVMKDHSTESQHPVRTWGSAESQHPMWTLGSAKSQHMVKIKCYLEGGPVDRFRRVLSKVEIHGWRGEITFKRSFEINGDDWETTARDAWSFYNSQR